MAREGLHASQAHRVVRDREPAQEIKRRALAAVHLECEKRTREAALGVANAYLVRIVKQRRVIHFLDLRMRGQTLDDALGALALAVHAQRDGRQPPIQEPAFVRLQDVAENRARAAQGGEVLGIAADDHSRQQVAESRERNFVAE